MSRAEMLAIMGFVEQRGEQSWTSHQVLLWDDLNCVAGDAVENQTRHLLREAGSEHQRHRTLNQKYQQEVQRHVSEVLNEVHSQQVASREGVDILRHELSHSPAEGTHYQNLYTSGRSGASEGSSEMQQLRQERVIARLVFVKRKLRKFFS